MADPPQQSSTVPWVVLLLVSAGVGLPAFLTSPQSEKSRATTPPPTPVAASEPARSEADVIELICDSLGITRPSHSASAGSDREIGSADTKDSEERQSANDCDDKAAGEKLTTSTSSRVAQLHDNCADLRIEFLIVTVPDPIDSHLQLRFDNQLASLQWAIEDEGFLLDRYSFPWKSWLKTTPGSAIGRRDYRTHPGVMIFRPQGAWTKSPTRLAVLLVGETPTSGVHKVALTQCLEQVALWNAAAEPGRHTLRASVLGPTFSGSTYSLRQCLDRWSDESEGQEELASIKGIEVSICSGSATSTDNSQSLNTTDQTARLRLSFNATVIPDEIALEKMFDYLQNERRIPPQKLAILSEAGTGYGNLPASGAGSIPEKVVQLKFPPQIGRLRSEYDKLPELKYGPTGATQPTLRTSLQLLFDQNAYAVDVPPIFSDEEVVEVERQLASTLSAISRRDIRALGIMATDVNDILFLAKEVRSYSPDVQLFAVDNDVLYSAPDYVRYTEGMLVASTYPLFANNQSWTGSTRVLPFPSNASEGVYNAACVLLNRIYAETGNYPIRIGGDRSKAPSEYHTPFVQGNKPPLWLTITGRDGVWPAKIWDYEDKQNYVHIEQQQTVGDDSLRSFPSGVNAFVMAMLSLVCVYLLFVRNPWLRKWPRQAVLDYPDDGGPDRWYSSVWTPFAPLPSHVADRESATFQDCQPRRQLRREAFLPAVGIFASLLLLNLEFSAPLWQITMAELYGRGEHVTSWIVLPINVIAVSLVTYSVLRLAWEFLLSHRPKSTASKPILVGGMGLVVLAILVFAGVWCCPWDAWCRGDKLPAAIFAERFGTYSSGVSPLIATSLLSIVWGMWGCCHLRRLAFLDYYNIKSPLVELHNLDSALALHVSGIETRTAELMDPIGNSFFRVQRLTDVVFLVATAISVSYVFVIRWNGTVEGWPFDYFFILLAFTGVILTAGLHVRLMAVSGLFERLLRRLGQHASTDALRYVPERLAGKAAGSIFSAAPHPGDYEQSVRLLTQIGARSTQEQSPDGGLPGDLNEQINLASRLFVELMSLRRTGRLRSLELAASLNSCLARASRQFAPRLAKIWSTRPVARDAESKTPADWSTRPDADVELFVVMQITHLIRQVFAHIQNLLTFVVIMSLLLLWALNSYPFQPHRLILVFSYAIVVWVIASFLVIFVKFNRDEVLSRLAGTTPNRFTWDRSFLLPLFTYVVLPLLGLAAVQFPEVGQSLFSWIGFVQRALHG